MSNDFERWVQSRLTSHGLPVGMIDGILGPVSIKALKQFQASHGIEPTGKTDAATVAALRGTTAGTVTRPDGEPNVPGPARNVWPTQANVPQFYGAVGTSQTQIEIPFDMVLAWDRSQRVRKMTLHTKVAPSAILVFQKVAGIYSLQEREALGLNIFGGSLNVRKKRGGSTYSMHSWGIAIDFDPERNALNTKAPQARLSHQDAVPFWAEWEKEGWLSLGRARNFDWMHIQAARL